jgi:two-component system, chemotaxis family, chemotaxis protein CheY
MSTASKILLVDDSKTARSLVRVLLMSEPVEFLEAENATAALGVVRDPSIVLVIADNNMPGMDGVTFVEALRKSHDERLRTIPVVLLTADEQPLLRQRALAAGANDFVRKPVKAATLRAAIDPLLAKMGVVKPTR